MFILLYHPDAEECWSHDILRCHGMSNKYNFLELCQELRFSLHRQANALYYNSCSSQIYIFRINSFKSLAKANKVPPSISCLLWPDISLQTKTRSWLVWKEDIFQGILDNQAHTSHHALPSEYPVHFLPPLISKRQISHLWWHFSYHPIPLLCTLFTTLIHLRDIKRWGEMENLSWKEDP